VTEPQWNELLDSNLRAAFFLCQAFKDELQLRNGAIINLVDIHADNPLKHHSVYNIAKAGLKAMTKSLAKDLAPEIRVNGVSPGAILWPQNLEGKSDKAVEDAKKDILSQIPLGHLGTPDDIAEAVYFLARKASYITGQVIRVDGGRALS
jgi:pteridine reductase